MAVVMIGVDPHKALHATVAIGAAEEPPGELGLRACAAQAERALDVLPKLGARVRLLATGDVNKNDLSRAPKKTDRTP